MGGKGGTILRPPDHYGGAESLRGTRKIPNKLTNTSLNAVNFLPKTSVSNMGTPNLLLAPGAV